MSLRPFWGTFPYFRWELPHSSFPRSSSSSPFPTPPPPTSCIFDDNPAFTGKLRSYPSLPGSSCTMPRQLAEETGSPRDEVRLKTPSRWDFNNPYSPSGRSVLRQGQKLFKETTSSIRTGNKLILLFRTPTGAARWILTHRSSGLKSESQWYRDLEKFWSAEY